MEISRTSHRSSMFVLAGIISMHASQEAYLAYGDLLRAVVLGTGFGLILFAALYRYHVLTRAAGIPIVASISLSLWLLIQSYLNHQNVFGTQNLAFYVVCIALFISGVVLGAGRRPIIGFPYEKIQAGATLIVVAGMVLFARSIIETTIGPENRDYGDIDLNPIAVAYLHTLLALVWAILTIYSHSQKRKWLFGAAAIFSMIIVLSSGSRAALLWGPLSFVIGLIGIARGGTVSKMVVRHSLIVLVLLSIAGAVVVNSTDAYVERTGMLGSRINQFVESATGEGTDLSVNERLDLWKRYLGDPDLWWPLGEPGYQGYPHNQFLEFLGRFGIAGVPLIIFSIWSFVSVIRYSFNKRKVKDLEIAVIFVAFIFAYLQSMTSLSLEMNRMMWLGFGYTVGLSANQRMSRARN